MSFHAGRLHENDGKHKNDENDKDNSDSYKQGVECWTRGNHGNDKNDGNPGRKPRVLQTTGLEIPDQKLSSLPWGSYGLRNYVKFPKSAQNNLARIFAEIHDAKNTTNNNSLDVNGEM